MVEKDYIMRQLQEFLNAIDLLLNSNKEDFECKIEDYYHTFIKVDRLFFIENNTEQIISKIDSLYSENSLLVKQEILAELLYRDAINYKDRKLRENLLRKSLHIWETINKNSTTFSLNRNKRIEIISGLIN